MATSTTGTGPRAGEARPVDRARTAWPDMTLPLVVDDATTRRWEEADTQGSPDAAYAVGMVLAQRGDKDGALVAWRRADARGSARGACAVGAALWSLGRHEAAEAAWRRGAERGSAGAAYSLAALAATRGDEAELGPLVDRALALAQAADEGGSPDGACLAAQLLAWKGEAAASEAAGRRARGCRGVLRPLVSRVQTR
jgi:hypothetical protein